MGIVSVSGACPLPLPGDAPLVCLPLVVVIVFNCFLLGNKVKEQTLHEQSLPLSTSIVTDLISFAGHVFWFSVVPWSDSMGMARQVSAALGLLLPSLPC